MPLTYVPLGDRTLSAQFEPMISVDLNQRIHAFAALIRERNIPGVTQTVVTFHTLAVLYDPNVLLYDELERILRQLELHIETVDKPCGKLIHIPVAFGGEWGPDLDETAAEAQMTSQRVVELLAERTYYVHMVGFIAGLPYCGEIDERLAKPRRTSPRLHVPRGSVAIADRMATVYTIDSPGGWHLLGWTPMLLFDPHRDVPGLLQAGDSLRFVPIEASEARAWCSERQREWDEKWLILK